MLGIWVDDGLICSMKPTYIDEIVAYLETTFKVVHKGVDCFVGFQIFQIPINHNIFIHQTRYIQDILVRFSMQDSHAVITPAEANKTLSACNDLADELIQEDYS